MDKNTRTTIKLNGQSYHSLPGRPAGSGNIDGIVARHGVQKNYSKPKVSQPAKARRTQVRSAQSRHPLPAHTLMRSAVKKPAKSDHLISNVSSPMLSVVKSESIKSTPMIGGIDAKLARRASTFKISKQISRFGASVRGADPKSPYVNPTAEPVQAVTPKPQAKKPDIFDQAIAKATSHEQPPLTKKQLKEVHGKKPRRHKKLAIYTTSGLVALLVIGAVGYFSMPNLLVKVASLKAGFSASLPSYSPSGYSLASVGYQSGLVSLNFKSVKDNNFILTERTSDWDSATLVSSIVTPLSGSSYKTTMINGQTVYIYGKDQAAWVSDGVLYQVEGNGNLNPSQLVQLATNL